MKPIIASALVLAAVAAATPAFSNETKVAGEEIVARVVDQPDGLRTLVHEAVIEAPPSRVWDAFSTVEGWKSWGVKFAEMDVRTAGTIESGYIEGVAAGDPRNIVHRILALVPERMLVTRIERAPQGGPVGADDLGKLWAVYELEPLEGDRTLLRISGHGYREGPEFDRMLGFFTEGNKASIEMMRSALTDAGS